MIERMEESEADTAVENGVLSNAPIPTNNDENSNPPSTIETGTKGHGDHGEELKLPRAVFILAGCAAFNSANLGFDIGVNTGATKKLQDSMSLSDRQIELFIGMLILFGIPGALGSHFVSDRLGRRGAFVVAAVGFILGIIVTCLARNYTVLMLSRVLVGLGIGMGFAVDPIYIAEISPAAHRGRLVTWSEIGTNVGIVLGFSSGLFFHNVPDHIAWRGMYALGLIMPTVMIFLACFVMPESPRWLVQKGRDEEAEEVLHRIYPPDFDIHAVKRDIRENIEKDTQAEHAVGWKVILRPSPAFRRMIIIGICTAVSQKLVGIDAIQYYLVWILEEAGITDDIPQTLTLIFLAVIKLLFIFIAGRQFDRFGRKVMLILSCFGMCFALSMLAVVFLSSSPKSAWAIVGMVLYLTFFSLGMGPGAWLIPSEIFANVIRTKAMSLATSLHFVFATIMSTTALSLVEAISYSGYFLLLGGLNILVAAFLYFFLPETKGLSLEDMSHYFAQITGDRSVLDLESRLSKSAAVSTSSNKENNSSTVQVHMSDVELT